MTPTRTMIVIAGLMVIVLGAGLVWMLVGREDSTATTEPPEQPDTTLQPFLSNQATCSTTEPDVASVRTEPYTRVSESRGAGTVMIEGTLVAQTRTIWGSTTTPVYVAVATSSPALFEELNKERVSRGNTVNRLEGEQLLFKVGVLENGTLRSSANISERARTAIEHAVGTNERLRFSMHIPVYEGSGAPADFTFACAIVLSEDSTY